METPDSDTSELDSSMAERCADFLECATSCAGELECYADCFFLADRECADCFLDAALACADQCRSDTSVLDCARDCQSAPEHPMVCVEQNCSEDTIAGWGGCALEQYELGACNEEFAQCGAEPQEICTGCQSAGRFCTDEGQCGGCLPGLVESVDGDCELPESCDGIDCGENGECAVESGFAGCRCDPGYAVIEGLTCQPAMITNAWVPIVSEGESATFIQGNARFPEALCHEVTIEHAYAMQRYEVSVAEYKLCVEATICDEIILNPDPFPWASLATA